jgi:hypothetical protein
LDSLCPQATELCAAAGGGVLMWVFTGPPGVAAPTGLQWQRSGQFCAQPGAIAAGVPVVTGADLRRLPLPAGVVHVQPGNGRTLVNVPTNVYLEAEVVVLPTVVLGQPVRVRATPSGFRWTFGDGASLETTDPGAPYPDLRVTHTYLRAGAVAIGLATTYRGEYSVAGGPWLPVAGTAVVDTPPVAVTVVEARSELVDSPLPS